VNKVKLDSMLDKDSLTTVLLGRYIMAYQLWLQIKTHVADPEEQHRIRSLTVFSESFFETKAGLAWGLWRVPHSSRPLA
jgi:hypothetical protein